MAPETSQQPLTGIYGMLRNWANNRPIVPPKDRNTLRSEAIHQIEARNRKVDELMNSDAYRQDPRNWTVNQEDVQSGVYDWRQRHDRVQYWNNFLTHLIESPVTNAVPYFTKGVIDGIGKPITQVADAVNAPVRWATERLTGVPQQTFTAQWDHVTPMLPEGRGLKRDIKLWDDNRTVWQNAKSVPQRLLTDAVMGGNYYWKNPAMWEKALSGALYAAPVISIGSKTPAGQFVGQTIKACAIGNPAALVARLPWASKYARQINTTARIGTYASAGGIAATSILPGVAQVLTAPEHNDSALNRWLDTPGVQAFHSRYGQPYANAMSSVMNHAVWANPAFKLKRDITWTDIIQGGVGDLVGEGLTINPQIVVKNLLNSRPDSFGSPEQYVEKNSPVLYNYFRRPDQAYADGAFVKGVEQGISKGLNNNYVDTDNGKHSGITVTDRSVNVDSPLGQVYYDRNSRDLKFVPPVSTRDYLQGRSNVTNTLKTEITNVKNNFFNNLTRGDLK